jgi:hypothetical protein
MHVIMIMKQQFWFGPIIDVLFIFLIRQASFVEPLMEEQRSHISCVGMAEIDLMPSKSDD